MIRALILALMLVAAPAAAQQQVTKFTVTKFTDLVFWTPSGAEISIYGLRPTDQEARIEIVADPSECMPEGPGFVCDFPSSRPVAKKWPNAFAVSPPPPYAATAHDGSPLITATTNFGYLHIWISDRCTRTLAGAVCDRRTTARPRHHLESACAPDAEGRCEAMIVPVQGLSLRVAPESIPVPPPGPHDTRVLLCAGDSVGTDERECFQVFNDGIVDVWYRDGREARYKALGAVPKADREHFGRIYRRYRLTRCYEVPGPLWWRIRPGMSTRACGAPT